MILGIQSDEEAFAQLYFPSCVFPDVCVQGLGSVSTGGARNFRCTGCLLRKMEACEVDPKSQ